MRLIGLFVALQLSSWVHSMRRRLSLRDMTI